MHLIGELNSSGVAATAMRDKTGVTDVQPLSNLCKVFVTPDPPAALALFLCPRERPRSGLCLLLPAGPWSHAAQAVADYSTPAHMRCGTNECTHSCVREAGTQCQAAPSGEV